MCVFNPTATIPAAILRSANSPFDLSAGAAAFVIAFRKAYTPA